MGEYIPWWKDQASFREKKSVIKLYDEDRSFLTSVHIPSVYWPLNGPYEVFTYENTCYIEEENVVSLFNDQTYNIGHCYQNTTRIKEAFQKAGYEVKTYCGWAFIFESVPIHHCWAVLTDEEGNQAVLDLSCDSFQMRQWFASREYDEPNQKLVQAKERLTEWVRYSMANLTNAQRCYPLGMIPPTHLYIGAECDPEQGIVLYNKLMAQNPHHLCERRVNAEGYNHMQVLLKQQGLMD